MLSINDLYKSVGRWLTWKRVSLLLSLRRSSESPSGRRTPPDPLDPTLCADPAGVLARGSGGGLGFAVSEGE